MRRGSGDAELLELQAALSAKKEEKKQLLDKTKKQLRDKLNKTAEEVEHLKEKGDAKGTDSVTLKDLRSKYFLKT